MTVVTFRPRARQDDLPPISEGGLFLYSFEFTKAREGECVARWTIDVWAESMDDARERLRLAIEANNVHQVIARFPA